MKLKTILLAALSAAFLTTSATAQLAESIWGKTALGAAPASNDLLLLYDTSATASKTMTIANLLTSGTFTTPALGVATATSINGLTITTSTGTLTIANGKTLTASNTLTFTGTDASSVAFGTGGTVIYAANHLGALASTTSAQLAGVLSNESGTGVAVFNDTPTLVTPVLGVATATSINGLTLTSSTGTLTITNGKTLAVSNTLTFTGTDASSVAFGTGGTVTYTANNLSVFAATTSAQLAGVLSNETGTGAFVLAETPSLVNPSIAAATLSGTIAASGATITSPAITSPTLTTPVIGVATGTSLAVTGALSTSSAATPIGYATGAGGAVTQGTSRTTTAVVSPNPCTSGTITTTADSMAAQTPTTFTVTNSAVSATDNIVITKVSGDVDTFAWVNSVGSGSFTVTLFNTHASDADVTAFVFNFAVINGVAN